MGLHTDLHHPDGEVRRVSASVQLSGVDDLGTCVTFTADVQHEVREVTAGERWALVAWAYGPSVPRPGVRRR